MPFIMATFEQAERAAEGGTVSDTELQAVFEKWVTAPAEMPTGRNASR